MNTLRIITVLIFGLSIFCISCEDEIDNAVEVEGKEYFPLIPGKYVSYRSDSMIVKDGGIEIEIVTSYIKEEVGEQLMNEQGDTSYKIYRYIKDKLEDEWELSDVWTAAVNDLNATKTEENLTFIKLVFPPRLNKRWDGNVFFDTQQDQTIGDEPIRIYDNWDYRIVGTGEQIEFNGMEFQNTVLIEQVDYETAISLRKSFERYAPNVGLIYKEQEIFDTQNGDGTVEWLDRAEAGYKHTLQIIDYN